jgi:hypothetical protein
LFCILFTALMRFPELSIPALGTSAAGLGLYIFFAVSGYLNTIRVARQACRTWRGIVPFESFSSIANGFGWGG